MAGKLIVKLLLEAQIIGKEKDISDLLLIMNHIGSANQSLETKSSKESLLKGKGKDMEQKPKEAMNVLLNMGQNQIKQGIKFKLIK